VNFPVEGLDLTDYLVNDDLPEGYFKTEETIEIEGVRVLYDLIGISNHFGSTGGGHYTAYCKYSSFYSGTQQVEIGMTSMTAV
jgi:ubiquitin C-terminal hydrolase